MASMGFMIGAALVIVVLLVAGASWVYDQAQDTLPAQVQSPWQPDWILIGAGAFVVLSLGIIIRSMGG
jgi:hypothetical protein